MIPNRTLRGVLSTALSTALLIASMALPAGSAVAATADTTITVGSTAVGVFGSDMLGSNLTPWGGFWPNTYSANAMKTAGLGLLRVGHGEKVYVDMEKWYPAHGQWNWAAGGTVTGVSHSFDEQIAWWKSLGIPVMYTLNDELSTAMLNQDGTLNYQEIAYAWAGHIKYLVDQGVNIKYVEIGNECDIAPGEGIQYPPVDNSSKSPSNKYVELHIGDPAYANGNNEYIKLWEAVVPAIKAAVPGMQVSAYPSGQGTVTSLSFPFDYLFQSAKSKPDFFPVHVYSFAAWNFVPSPQRLLDSTWQYSGRFVDWSNNVGTVAETLQGYGAPASLPIGITEWNYDGATQYDPGQGVNWGASQANSMWDAMFAASVLANAANGGMDLTTFWETFPGSNTDELFDDDYMSTTPRSQALAYKLLKSFAGGVVRTSTVTSSDNAIAYDWQNEPVTPASVAGKRVECLATTDASGYRLLLINKNVSTQHVANVNLAELDEGTAVAKTYQTRDSLASGTPSTASNVSVTGGSFQITLPPMSVSVVSVNGDVTPPPNDIDAPTVRMSAPSNGAKVSGVVPLEAVASDTGSGVAKVEFFADGKLVGTDVGDESPYVAAWDSLLATPGTHTLAAKATDKVGLWAEDSVSVTVEGTVPTSVVVTLGGPSTAPVYGGSARLTAVVKDTNDALVTGAPVVFERWAGGSNWAVIGTKPTSAGSASLDARGLTSAQTFRARVDLSAGYAASPSGNVTVKPRAYVSNPIAPSYAYRGRTLSVYGYLKPRHTSGSYPVRIYRFRQVPGGWRSYGYVLARASNTSSYTKYSKNITLPYRGKWALRAYAPGDGGHVATYSTGYDYVIVK
jgi:Bacterial Ig domain